MAQDYLVFASTLVRKGTGVRRKMERLLFYCGQTFPPLYLALYENLILFADDLLKLRLSCLELAFLPSARATKFRIWATKILNEYNRKGVVLDDERLKQGKQGNTWIV